MKPGKPTTLAEVVRRDGSGSGSATRRVLVFALPGNPVSALVMCALLVAPVVRRLAGAQVSLLELPLQFVRILLTI